MSDNQQTMSMSRTSNLSLSPSPDTIQVQSQPASESNVDNTNPHQFPSQHPSRRYLTVGDGNFSFSKSLHQLNNLSNNKKKQRIKQDRHAKLPQPIELTATSFDDYHTCTHTYHTSISIIKWLHDHNVNVLHKINACQLKQTLQQQQTHRVRPKFTSQQDGTKQSISVTQQLQQPHDDTSSSSLSPSRSPNPCCLSFDVIIFNFPHLAVENLMYQRALLCHFFLSCLDVLCSTGYVHVTLCFDQPEQWHLILNAQRHGFECMHHGTFIPNLMYPKYEFKRGHNANQFPATRNRNKCKSFVMRIFIFTPRSNIDNVEAHRQHMSQHPELLLTCADDPSVSSQHDHNNTSDNVLASHTSAITPINSSTDSSLMAAEHRSSTSNQHKIAHSDGLVCQVCGRHCSSKETFDKHIQAHQKHQQALEAKGDLTLSIIKLAHACDVCDLSFNTADELTLHQVNLLIPTAAHVSPAQSFQCQLCHSTFGDQRALNQHIQHGHNQDD